MTSGAVTGAIDRLVSLGLVERRADPGDRRKVIVSLADHDVIRGFDERRPLVENFDALTAELADINEGFEDDQLEAISDWLGKSNTAVERSIDRMREALRRTK